MKQFNRVIPILCIDKDKLVKTIKFKKPNYIGDPVNAVKIFNEKEVDEIVLLDITATREGREPNYDKIEEICSEAFMPFAYGGGVSNLQQIKKIFSLGIEKVILNSSLPKNFQLISDASSVYGSQSIIASLDVKKSIFGKYEAYTNSGSKKVKQSLKEYINSVTSAGVGEIFLNSIDRDGTFAGYDVDLIKQISTSIKIPLVVCGGASKIEDFRVAIEAGASAVAAGSLFVYSAKGKGVLINYPSLKEIKSNNKI